MDREEERMRDLQRRHVINQAKIEASLVENELRELKGFAPQTAPTNLNLTTDEIFTKLSAYRGISYLEDRSPSPAKEINDSVDPYEHCMTWIQHESKMEQLKTQHRREVDNIQNDMMDELTQKMQEFESACKNQYAGQIFDLEETIHQLRMEQKDALAAKAATEISRLNEEILVKKLQKLTSVHESMKSEYSLHNAKLESEVENARYTMRRELTAETEANRTTIQRLETQLDYSKKDAEAWHSQIEKFQTRVNEKEAECHNWEAKITDMGAQLLEARNGAQEIDLMRIKLEDERKMRVLLDDEYKKVITEIGEVKNRVRNEVRLEYEVKVQDLEFNVDRLTKLNSELMTKYQEKKFRVNYDERQQTIEENGITRLRNENQELLREIAHLQNVKSEQVSARMHSFDAQVKNTGDDIRWKEKTTLLATKYYDALRNLRQDYTELKQSCLDEQNRMHQDFDKTMDKVIRHYTEALTQAEARNTGNKEIVVTNKPPLKTILKKG